LSRPARTGSHELKHEGFTGCSAARSATACSFGAGRVRDWTAELVGIATALRALPGDFVLDSEAVAHCEAGLPDFHRLMVRDGLVLRYDSGRTDDGLPGGEGAFLACSFWLADAYVMLGRLDDARHLFDRLLALRNDVGLLAEEYDPELSRQLGNVPQAFSHVALVNTAFNLSRAVKPVAQRAEQEAVHA
jgi:hypothetical protein